jgi:hypothetical protein
MKREKKRGEHGMKEFDEVPNAKSKHKIYVHWLLTWANYLNFFIRLLRVKYESRREKRNEIEENLLKEIWK